ncbi:hypothetical protein [Streptomyces spectabilis]|uniref:Uncharacterized protein n=1 Tax=Streptomyces spectabilis TaxID=68270 RepID=A0A7W8EWW6_STRST|nr:hypothetical protein [Streptomyces spectabilis]MBB5108387.1 hypothetical protein [Streptomyces spectabilis]MCI3901141.1 hypothetical protein [Streptomyces spectabilis]
MLAEPDPQVQELLDDSTPVNAWGINERSYPIIVTETITRVLFVQAENEDDALAYWVDDWTDIPLKEATVIEGYLEFERPDEFQRQEAFGANGGRPPVGPQIACPDCGGLAYRRSWFHDPYRKCHGPITWRTWLGRVRRDHRQTSAFTASGTSVKAVA